MKPINFSGINCYCSCAINAAAFSGVDCKRAFGSLWSETDFCRNARHEIYLSKRLFADLREMGAEFKSLSCTSPEVIRKNLSETVPGDQLIIGMDAYDILQNPFYKMLHCLHYFIARKENADLFYCCDPMYGSKITAMAADDIAPYAFDMRLLDKTPGKKLPDIGLEDAGKAIESCPVLQILNEVQGSSGKNHKNAKPIAMYMDALAGNRRLYKAYLQSQVPGAEPGLFDDKHFKAMAAIKNGLIKASLTENNEKTIAELCPRISELFAKECAMAKEAVEGQSKDNMK